VRSTRWTPVLEEIPRYARTSLPAAGDAHLADRRTQAALNVLTARATNVTNEVEALPAGRYGKAPDISTRRCARWPSATRVTPAGRRPDRRRTRQAARRDRGHRQVRRGCPELCHVPQIANLAAGTRRRQPHSRTAVAPGASQQTAVRAMLPTNQDHAARRDLPYQAVGQRRSDRHPAPLFRVDRWRFGRSAVESLNEVRSHGGESAPAQGRRAAAAKSRVPATRHVTAAMPARRRAGQHRPDGQGRRRRAGDRAMKNGERSAGADRGVVISIFAKKAMR